MSDQKAFLRTIQANPEDDTPRLVYADWLEEQGDLDQAEFIRIQCEMATLDPLQDRYQELEQRANELCKGANRQRWLGSLRSYLRGKYEFHRGFVDHVIVQDWFAWNHGAWLFEQGHPIIALSVLATANSPLGQLFQCPWLQNLRTLRFINRRLGDEGMHMLATCPYLQNLNYLNVSQDFITADGIQRYLQSPVIPCQRRLEFWANRLRDDAVRIIARSPKCAGLEELNLGGNLGITDWGADALARSPYISELRSLSVWGTQITDTGAIQIVQSSHSQHLRSLNLLDCPIGLTTATAIAQSPCLMHLHTLYLAKRTLNQHQYRIGDEGVSRLAQSPYLKHLKSLRLENNGITNTGAKALIDSASIQDLRYLDLTRNSISSGYKRALRKRFPNCTCLFSPGSGR